jgi:hypothetical protein
MTKSQSTMKPREEVAALLNKLCDTYCSNHVLPDTTAMMQYMVHGHIRGLCFVLGIDKPSDDEILAGWRVPEDAAAKAKRR